jgi:putative membrane protein
MTANVRAASNPNLNAVWWFDEAVADPDTPPPQVSDATQRTMMAAERTWLAWWRTALAATAGALAVGRLAPELLHVAPWPYIVLGCGYATLSIALLAFGAWRQRQLERAVITGESVSLRFALVAAFSLGGIALAVMTIVLVIVRA